MFGHAVPRGDAGSLGSEAGGRAGRRRAAPRQSPASRPLPGAGGEGLRPPLPPAPPHPDQEIVESRWRMGNVKIERGGRDGAEQPHRPVCAAVLPDPPGAILGGGVGVFALRALFTPRRKFHATVAVPKNG